MKNKESIPTLLNQEVAPVFTIPEKLSDMDKMSLELARSRRQLALAQAEKALAQNETADIAYKYIVLQLYMKYGLTEVDAINENGDILKGGAVRKDQQ